MLEGYKSRFYDGRLILTAPTPRIIVMPFLTHISLLVRDYDEAITFYSRLGFEVVEDTFIPQQQKRWVTIRPPPPPQPLSNSISGERQTSPDERVEQEPTPRSVLASSQGATILLARPSNAEQEAFVGNQTGGRVFLFLATDDFERDFKRFSGAGVEWARPPKIEAYGKVAVWKDLYGNLWDLIQYH
jgi:catechol 2,3-dioxygenase-like lactoylglutathione lyase family enzyme